VKELAIADSVPIARRNPQPAADLFGEVFADRPGFDENNATFLPIEVLDDGRFAERMKRLQFQRRAHVRTTFIALDRVPQTDFLEHP
jgi:hypothetical protein